MSSLWNYDYAILETTGEVSVYFFDHGQIKYGLPILPYSLTIIVKVFETETFYSCNFSGQTVKYHIENSFFSPQCNKNGWVKANNRKVNH